MRARLYALCLMVASVAQAHAHASATGQVIVELVGLRNTRGQVFLALYRSADGFPSQPAKAFIGKKEPIKSKQQLSVVFEAVPAGSFAISVFHDENGNSHLETGPLGIPKEGWGTSRDAKATFGPPSFDDAQLTLAAGERKHIVIHLRY
jgi:uncharacterized protein (DUF2141 family)